MGSPGVVGVEELEVVASLCKVQDFLFVIHSIIQRDNYHIKQHLQLLHLK